MLRTSSDNSSQEELAVPAPAPVANALYRTFAFTITQSGTMFGGAPHPHAAFPAQVVPASEFKASQESVTSDNSLHSAPPADTDVATQAPQFTENGTQIVDYPAQDIEPGSPGLRR